MTLIIGKIQVTNIDNVISTKGRMATHALVMDFKLEPRDSMRSDDSPSHDVIGKGAHGGPFMAGVAWQGKTKEGKPMFSIELTIPELFKEKLKLVAFEFNNQPGAFELKYSKEIEQPKQATAA